MYDVLIRHFPSAGERHLSCSWPSTFHVHNWLSGTCDREELTSNVIDCWKDLVLFFSKNWNTVKMIDMLINVYGKTVDLKDWTCILRQTSSRLPSLMRMACWSLSEQNQARSQSLRLLLKRMLNRYATMVCFSLHVHK